MYIISKKKDYYDGVVGTMGIDRSIVYARETQTFENWTSFPKEFRPNKPYNSRYKNHFLNLDHHTLHSKPIIEGYSSFIVGFCGKLYIGWKLYRKVPNPYSVSTIVTDITYDYELVKKYVKTVSWYSNLDDDMEYIKSYDPMHIFRDLKSPIFVYDSDRNGTSMNPYRRRNSDVFIVNPILNEYKFYTVIDSFTAFQELSMFMGGILGSGEKEIVEVEDKYKITQHGFNKWLFRREPEKKR
jgi:hypothetical protein